MVATLPQLLAQRWTTPDAPAIRAGTALVTYGNLERRSRELAVGLIDAGVRRGDRVAFQVPKSAEVLVLHVALLRCGAIQVPLNPAYADAELEALLADAEPTLVVHDPARVVPVGRWQTATLDAAGQGSLMSRCSTESRPLPDVRPDDGAALLYTSGTTGRPKGALLTHRNLVHNAVTLTEAWGFRADDVLLHCLPLFHTHGLFVATHCALVSGACIELLPAFDVSAVVEALGRSTVMMGVPTHYARLLSDRRFDEAAHAPRLLISGSAPMSASLHREIEQRTGQQVLERYGMTETSMLTSNPLVGPRRPGSVGVALPGVQLRIANPAEQVDAGSPAVGEVEVVGPNVFGGYWRRPDLQSEVFTEDGWFRTGDLGWVDEHGYLYLVGRSKDLVISGGLNVYPADVESVLDDLEGVRESAVVGVLDNDLGERVVAVVVPREGAHVDPERLRITARRRLAGYKVPKEVHVWNALPRNAMGKVEKAKVRERLQAAQENSHG
jgi:malonyl-CoA/methylmalonyl-CoA synthetase